jgi:hypothetical protein
MTNWIPDSFVGEMFKSIGNYVPPPASLKPPFLWGTEEGLRELFGDRRELFGDRIDSLRTKRRSFVLRYPSARYFVNFFRTYYGPMSKTFEALDEEGRESLEGDLIELVERFNRSGDETTVFPSDYLEVVAVKR